MTDVERAEVFAEQPALAYAVGEYAERNRRIMRVFYLNKTRDIGPQLAPTDVQRRLRQEFQCEMELDALERTLDWLAKKGNLDPQPNMRDAVGPAEWRRRRMLYDITPAGERVEFTLTQLDALQEDASALDSWRLAAIRERLRRLGLALQSPTPDAQQASEDLDDVTDQVSKLAQGATDFMSRLQRFTGSDKIDPDAFIAHQDAVIEHLQDFHQALRRHTEDILMAIREVEKHDIQRLITLALSVRPSPVAMPGQNTGDLMAQIRLHELRRWEGVRAWFSSGGDVEAPWELMSHKLFDAIHSIVDIADRLIGRSADKRDRTAAWTQLARLVAGADEATATAAFAVAVGMRPPRHFAGTDPDPGQILAPGAASWRDAPSAPVAAHLRRPGSRKPGAGTPARLTRNTGLADRVAAQRATEQAQIGRLLERMQAGSTLQISELHTLHPAELEHVLTWISRAFTQRALGADGSRTATSADGNTTLRLTPPTDNARTRITVDTGELDCPDYKLEVLR